MRGSIIQLVYALGVTLVFLVDIFVQFVLPLPERGTAHRGELSYERRHWKLAKRYVLSWFTLDVVTIIPFDLLVLLGALSTEVKIVKTLRVLRLLKIAKVLRASSIIQRWENSFAVPYTKQTLSLFSFASVVLRCSLSACACDSSAASRSSIARSRSSRSCCASRSFGGSAAGGGAYIAYCGGGYCCGGGAYCCGGDAYCGGRLHDGCCM